MIRSTRVMVAAMALATLSAWGPRGAFTRPLAAQEPRVVFGAGLLSRYVWRGMEYSTAVQAQPWVQADMGPIQVGAWASVGLDGEYKEQNEWITWTRALPQGFLGVTVIDYYFTDDYRDYFEWGGVKNGAATGAHTLEAVLSYQGPEARPVRVMMASTFYNDPRASVYGEVGYALDRYGLLWDAQLGYLFRDGGYYELGSGGLTNLTLSATRSLGSLGPLAFTATAYLIHNPKVGRTHLAFEIAF